MRIATLRFEKLHNLGNYENEKLGIEVILEDGDDPLEALARARRFVNQNIETEDDYKHTREEYRKKLAEMEADPDSYAANEILKNREWLEEHPAPDPSPF